jgi:glycosyltransferase involved in cell wall biosynthesis
MASHPGVSVVIPTYDRAHFVGEALDSVLAQDWPLLEVVVVDNGSTDGTPALLMRYSERDGADVQVIRLDPNAGPSTARNVGIDSARYDLIALLDSDNRWVPGKLRRQMKLFESDPALDLTFAGYEAFGDASGSIILEGWDGSQEHALEELLVGCCVNTSTVIARREALVEAGLFDPRMDGAEDYEFWLRFAARGFRIGYIPEALAEYRIHGGALSADVPMQTEQIDRVFRAVFESGSLPASFQSKRRLYLARCYLNSACRYLDIGEGSLGFNSLWRAATTRPRSVRPGWFRLVLQALGSRLGVRARQARPRENPHLR